MVCAATTWNIVVVTGPCLHSAPRLRAENKELRCNVHGRQKCTIAHGKRRATKCAAKCATECATKCATEFATKSGYRMLAKKWSP